MEHVPIYIRVYHLVFIFQALLNVFWSPCAFLLIKTFWKFLRLLLRCLSLWNFLSMYYCFIDTYSYLTTCLRGGTTGSNVRTEFSAQTTTMNFIKLFVKLFTAILLISSFIMEPDGTYTLTHTGTNKIFSIHGRWN